MKRAYGCLVALVLIGTSTLASATDKIVVAGLVSQRGKSLPTPSQGFVPKELLSFPFTQVYKAVVAVLDESNVSILNADKEEGRIATDYVPGPSFSAAGGLLGSNSTRYKYLISIKDTGQGVKLKITAHLESSGNKIQSWRDVSDNNDYNRAAVADVEKALAEKVEKQLAQ